MTRFTLNPEKKAYERRDKALTGMALTRTLATLEEAGYDEEEMNVDREAYGDGEAASRALFVIPVTYRLEGDQFIVNVSTENIEGNDFILQSITVLPYFGAAGTKQQGYMFVPDGSGSIINLNNGKLDAYPYNETLYGIDATRLDYLTCAERITNPLACVRHEEGCGCFRSHYRKRGRDRTH